MMVSFNIEALSILSLLQFNYVTWHTYDMPDKGAAGGASSTKAQADQTAKK